MTREKCLMEYFKHLQILYNDLHKLIIEYEKTQAWKTTVDTSWKINNSSYGIVSSHQLVYHCSPWDDIITTYTRNGEIFEQLNFISKPAGIDLDIKNSLLYIVSLTSVTIRNLLQSKNTTSWKLRMKGCSDYAEFRGIKIDEDIVYLTLQKSHQIFLCDPLTGKILKTFGVKEKSSKPGEFYYPRGITLNKTYLYVCDSENQRVQVLNKKEKGVFISQWGDKKTGGTNKGEFYYPYSLFHDPNDELYYVGDYYSLQTFQEDGKCIQRLGSNKSGSEMNQFNVVNGICRIDDQLFVSDLNNKRIQIFTLINS